MAQYCFLAILFYSLHSRNGKAQPGKLPVATAKRKDLAVEGEKRYWLHVGRKDRQTL
jgi:hypothetical protein